MLVKTTNSILKTSDGKTLLKDIHFSIQKGDLVYIHGANGVGKSCLVKAILGYDSLKLNDLEKSRFTYSYLPQMENKEFLLPLRLKDLSPKDYLLTQTELDLSWNKASGGERKKAMLGRVLDQDVDLYVLDEPYNHLDKASILKMNQILEKKLTQGKTVFLISHQKPQINKANIIDMDINLWSS